MIEKLLNIQSKLNAPKNLKNNFGGYAYRNTESILEAVKPLLKAEGLLLTLSDSLVNENGDIYIESTATITDGEKSISSKGYARERRDKKGMDVSQMTGSASSYARKMALGRLLLVDDNKDADSTELTAETNKRELKQNRDEVQELQEKAKEEQKAKLKKAEQKKEEPKVAKGEKAENVIVCEVCGKRVAPDFAEKCKARNDGHIFCSKICKDNFFKGDK